MSEKVFGCLGCGTEGGSEDDNNYCVFCHSYKYFGWLELDE